MENNGIIPEFISKPPRHTLSITYNDKQVNFGNELTPFEVKNQPRLHWESHPNKYYSLLMFDPDAPSREKPLFGDVKHWLVVNILGNDLSTGQEIAPYSGSGPPKNTGLHRYIFFVFEQNDKIMFNEPITPPNSRKYRLNYDAKGFMKKFGFEEVYAGNYFQAQYDDYVGRRHGWGLQVFVRFVLMFYCCLRPFFKKRA